MKLNNQLKLNNYLNAQIVPSRDTKSARWKSENKLLSYFSGFCLGHTFWTRPCDPKQMTKTKYWVLGIRQDFGRIFKILWISCISKIYDKFVQTKCKLSNAVLYMYLKLFHIQSKEIQSKKYYEESREKRELEKMVKWDFAWISMLKRRRKTFG